ncbi:hypothetical protein [Bifidobacterium castoris]|uniref:Uncharacterized protein n=1 Tax=Bifidobacterium castoris TaxID=2306972 RepID=A0A430F4C9_9BIFI|nr:hypothetical protein [Bifidobacterium castoris]RSX44658.1 hypothetical protein D2E22_1944 [Bifidobacterium castoris]
MRTRISKHGKYEIREGVASEIGDSLEPGDLLTTLTADGKSIDVEVINPITNDDEFNEAITKLPAEVFIIVALARATVTDFYSLHPYLVRCLQDGEYNMWLSTKTESIPVKIKHPLHDDEPITADKVDADIITEKKVYTDGTVKVPNMPGLYKDCSGDVLVAFHNLGASKLYYSYITIEGQECLSLFEFARPVEDLADRWAPYTRITSIEQLRKAINAGVES